MGIDFYYTAGAVSCRSILMLANVLDVKLNLINVDLRYGAHMDKEFMKVKILRIKFLIERKLIETLFLVA